MCGLEDTLLNVRLQINGWFVKMIYKYLYRVYLKTLDSHRAP